MPVALQGATYRELSRRAIERGAPFTPIGFVRHGERDGRPLRQVVLAPLPRAELGRDTKLGAADELVAIAGAELDLARWLAATD